MNILRKACFVPKMVRFPTFRRSYCDSPPPQKFPIEKSINNVTLLGRVGSNPQLRGSESKPIAVFTLATNSNFRYETGELQQKTEWHRIVVFKPLLKDVVIEHLKKGHRVYIDGKIIYGEYADKNGVTHATTSISANEIIFLNVAQKVEEKPEDVVENAI